MAKKSGHKRLSSKDQTLVVHLEDHGQDFLKFHIKDSVIVETHPFQGSVWNGRKFKAITFEHGDYLEFVDDDKHLPGRCLKYPVAKVEVLSEVAP